MDQNKEELERKAEKARRLAKQILDREAAEGMLALAKELENKARQQ
jgi:hypothetical protein